MTVPSNENVTEADLLLSRILVALEGVACVQTAGSAALDAQATPAPSGGRARSTARKLDSHHFLFPEVRQMVVEEFTAIVRMQFMDGKRHALKNVAKSGLHGALPATQDGHSLTPARCHIHHLQTMQVISGGRFSTMMHQIHLKMTRLLHVPGDSSHRHPFGHLIGTLRAFAW